MTIEHAFTVNFTA